LKFVLPLLILLATYTCSSDSGPQSSDLVGNWKIEITFENQEKRTLIFEAIETGKGTLLLEGPSSNWAEPAKPSSARWETGANKEVSITGPSQFPIGNVGFEPGTLVFKGKLEANGSIAGDAKFYPKDQDSSDPNAIPSKTGKFKGTRSSSK
jgi:hypothetical protein